MISGENLDKKTSLSVTEYIRSKSGTGNLYEKLYRHMKDDEHREITLKEWDRKRNRGIELHQRIEKEIRDYMDGSIDSSFIHEFLKVKKYDMMFPEYRIQSSNGLVGRIDLLAIKDGLEIIDWKSSKYIWYKSDMKMLSPYSELDDCNYNHARLQLSLYKHILEKDYGHIFPTKNISLKVIHIDEYSILEEIDIIPINIDLTMTSDIDEAIRNKNI